MKESFYCFFTQRIIPVKYKHWCKRFFYHRRWLFFYGVLLGMFLLFLFFDFLYPLKVRVNYSQLILAKDSTILQAYLTDDDKWRLKTEIREIIPELKNTILYKEDKYFYYHPGFNPFAILRAAVMNVFRGKKTSGASTITMQVARLLEPKKRTYIGKMFEIFRAIQLEWHYSKEEILQLYLNLIPYGGNVEGVKSAAMLYFNRLPDRLSLAQIVTLTIIPNRPTSLVIGKNNALILRERNKWLKKLQKSKIFKEKSIKTALNEGLNQKRKSIPAMAPHFCRFVKNQFPNEYTIVSTLAVALQNKVEELVYNYTSRLKQYNIHNAAVLVVNNHTMKVEAYVGSPDFEDKAYAGEVDGVQAIRSPGSALKPFLYALAIDKGLLTPKMTLADVPDNFSGFEPENFHKQFTGKVNLEKALIQSLNTTAVKTLDQYGTGQFIRKLKEIKFIQVAKDEKKLGLSMILGGCGVKLSEMTSLYTIFARGGIYQPLKFKNEIINEKGKQALSATAAYLVSDMLSKGKRPDLPEAFENTYKTPKIAWKTGTSYGRRDAWSLGYNPNYTVGVWLGNFSGEGVNSLIGAEMATPLLMEIFNALSFQKARDWFSPPVELKQRWVCTESGLLPDTFCKAKMQDYYIPLVSTTKKCTHLKTVLVSSDENASYCLSCLPAKGYKRKLYPNHSPELMAFYDVVKINFKKTPPHNEKCTRIEAEEGPMILSPSAEKEYIIDRQDPPELMLYCKAKSEVSKVYWYIDEVFYQVAKPNEQVFFKPSQGEMKISCIDDKGRGSDIRIRVWYE